MQTAPLVSVLVAVHNGEPFVRLALESVLRQSVSDLELVVVDDASTDETAATLAQITDARLLVLRNEEQLGLAGSLNRGLEAARGTFVARMDADDAAFRHWLRRCLALMRSAPDLGLVGAGVLDVSETGSPRGVHILEAGRVAMRWRALFSAPVFHNTVVLVRELLERNRLRYDTSYGESEDYELWTRVLDVSEGDSVEAPLVVHRLHEGQASSRRAELQSALAEQISLRQIARIAPGLTHDRARLARSLALGAALPAESFDDAADAYLELLTRFAEAHPYDEGQLRRVRRAAARALLRGAKQAGVVDQGRALGRAARLDPLLGIDVVRRRTRRRQAEARAAKAATRLLAPAEGRVEEATRVVAVFPEPTPYRAPLLDRVAAVPELDLTVIYAADTVARRTWHVEPRHRAVFLRGVRVPGARHVLHHDYPLTPGVVRVLNDAHPDVVVVSGWSTFAAQAAIAWCRLKDMPYVLVVESHDEGPRAGWRRKVKGTVVPPVVQNASGVLVTGTLARDSMIARGAPAEHVRVFANTIDVEEFGERADRLASERDALRRDLGAGPDDVVVLSVARLASEKGIDVLIRAVAAAGDPRIRLVLSGDGPERLRLDRLAEELGVRATFVGDTAWENLVELYVTADVFALLSEREPWAVVVNEAAACGLPLVLSDRVGAAHDLLRDDENGFLVPAGDVEAAAQALRALASDAELRRLQGARSRELARDWGYGPSVEGFVEAVREAAADRE